MEVEEPGEGGEGNPNAGRSVSFGVEEGGTRKSFAAVAASQESSLDSWVHEVREHLCSLEKEGSTILAFPFDGLKILQRYVWLRSRCVLMYFMGRPPSEIKLQRWTWHEEMRGYDIENFCAIGKGFFVVAVGATEMVDKLVDLGAIMFKGKLVQILPYTLSFSRRLSCVQDVVTDTEVTNLNEGQKGL